MKIAFGFFFIFFFSAANAQSTQQLRGTVTDQVLQQPLSAATVILRETGKTVITDNAGSFRFPALPIGTYHLLVTHTGFKEAIMENISVIAGKETVLNITMETAIIAEAEVIVKANSKKNKPLNDMSMVSARAFTVEETQKYAAAVNDPLRMAMAFPGVLAGDDGNNNIIIRGNSPSGLLWKMEGMDIPNPNHFSNPGSSGGGISILNSQLLANSDFITAAFAPEYGNALSGVFDIKLRKGNNEKREYTLQAGVLGLNAAAEGPFSKNYKGSYLVNYRYSTLSLLNKVGVLPGNAATDFQDLSYNVFLPTKKWGSFTIFGFGGWSTDGGIPKLDSSKWKTSNDRYAYDFEANTAFNGVTHSIALGKKAILKSGFGMASTTNGYDEKYVKDDYSQAPSFNAGFTTKRKNVQSVLQYKFSSRLHARAGVILNFTNYNYHRLSADYLGAPLQQTINSIGNTSTQQAFAQAQYKATDKLVFTGGLHYLHLTLNNTAAVEPRVSVKYAAGRKSSVALGYGLHSQVQAMGVYFARQQNGGSGYTEPNKNLGFTKAHHAVLSYQYRLSTNLQLKTELYYQHLFNVPVSTKDSSTFAVLNIGDDYVNEPLANKGKGRNYGIEISAERYLKNNFYLTVTSSLYQSKYTALDQVERNTRYNGDFISTLIAGKDFVQLRKQKTIGFNIKTIYAGGLRTTPIDYAASQQNGYGVYIEDKAYSLQNPSYFRTDVRLSIKWNKRHVTSTLSLDIQNITNRLNVFNQSYDETTNKIVTNYQTGIIPILNYKVEF